MQSESEERGMRRWKWSERCVEGFENEEREKRVAGRRNLSSSEHNNIITVKPQCRGSSEIIKDTV